MLAVTDAAPRTSSPTTTTSTATSTATWVEPFIDSPCADSPYADSPCNEAPCPDLGSTLQDDLSWLLLRAARGMGCAMAAALEALTLDTRGLMVLKTICNSSAPNQLAIAQAADIDKTTLVSILDELERKSFVRRVPGPDRRTRVVELTDDGRQMLAWAEAAGGDIQRAVLDALEPSDRDALLRSLPLLIHAIDRVTRGVQV
jgi:DNA-binding MarR family transcriptional regulator